MQRYDKSNNIVILFIFTFMLFHLYIDTITGISSYLFNYTLPTSQIFKGIIILSIIIYLTLKSPYISVLIICIILTIFIGPVFRLFQEGRESAFIEEATMILKATMPFIVLIFLNCIQRDARQIGKIWLPRILFFSFIAIIVNLIFGVFGYGFTSYGTTERGGLGIVGFFPAGNEVSAVFAVLSGYILTIAYNHGILRYFFSLAALILCGFLIATKSALLSPLLLGILIPIFYIRNFNWKILPINAVLIVSLIILFLIFILNIWNLLDLFGLSDRLLSIYIRQGLVGIFLSGRDIYISTTVDALYEFAHISDIIFGMGPEKIRHWGGKSTVELDTLDLFFWFGLPGLFYNFIIYFLFLYISIKGYLGKGLQYAPGIFATNITVISLATFSGHVLFGGMAGICWAVLNGLILFEQHEHKTD